MAYAQYTKVPVEQTKTDIESLLTKCNAKAFGMFSERTKSVIVFEVRDRRIRFDLPLPTGDDNKTKREVRQKWRALLLCIKAKLESVEAGIETFEEAFLSHVVMPDGSTVYQNVATGISIAYKSGQMTPLLAPPTPRPQP